MFFLRTLGSGGPDSFHMQPSEESSGTHRFDRQVVLQGTVDPGSCLEVSCGLCQGVKATTGPTGKPGVIKLGSVVRGRTWENYELDFIQP